MARRIHVIEVPRDATMPAENISGPEWSAAKAQIANASSLAELADTRVFDVRKYGDVGTPDDSATFQAAIDAASAAGGGVVTGPAGFYVFTTGLQLRHGVTLSFPGKANTVFDFGGLVPTQGIADFRGARHCVLAEGSYTTLPALASAVAKDSLTITLASTPGVAPGDWINLYNSTPSSFSTARANYNDGEFVQVKSVAGNVITLTKPTYTSHPVAETTVSKMAKMETGISGVSFVLPLSMYGVTFQRCTGMTLNDTGATGSNWACYQVSQCVMVSMDNPMAVTFAPNDSNNINYGLIISNSQHVSITNPFLESERHGYAMGGAAGVGCVPSRDVRIIGGTISTNGATVSGGDCHGNVEHIWFIGVSLPRGISIAGDHVHTPYCDIGSAPSGTAIYVHDMVGYDFDLSNVIVTATQQVNGNDGLISINPDAGTTRAGGHVRISGEIGVGTYRSSSGAVRGVHIYSIGAPARGDVTIDISGSATGTVTSTSMLGLWIRGSSGGEWRDVKVTTDFRGLNVLITQAVDTTLVNCRSVDAPGVGLQVSSPVGTNYIIRSKHNEVRRAGTNGIQLAGNGIGDGLIVSHGDESLNCNQSGGTSAGTASCVSISSVKTASIRDMVAGDTQSVATGIRAATLSTIGTLHESPITNVGELAVSRTAITTTVPV